MSRTKDLDRTIKTLNEMAEREPNQEEKLKIMDRLLKALALKYRHGEDGRGKKFQLARSEGDANA